MRSKGDWGGVREGGEVEAATAAAGRGEQEEERRRLGKKDVRIFLSNFFGSNIQLMTADGEDQSKTRWIVGWFIWKHAIVQGLI